MLRWYASFAHHNGVARAVAWLLGGDVVRIGKSEVLLSDNQSVALTAQEVDRA